MTPEQSLKQLRDWEKQLKIASKASVDVGIIGDKVGGTVYEGGQTILEVGAQHEYGAGVPQRSFIRLPFEVKKNDLAKYIKVMYASIMNGKRNTSDALGLVGVKANNIVIDAFETGGFGMWPPLSLDTIEAKGSSQILVDTGVLRRSVTWRVNNAT